jgi:hypothetical protein
MLLVIPPPQIKKSTLNSANPRRREIQQPGYDGCGEAINDFDKDKSIRISHVRFPILTLTELDSVNGVFVSELSRGPPDHIMPHEPT